MADTTAASSSVELEFAVRDRDCFFVDVSATESCRVELEHLRQRSDGQLLAFFTVGGTTTERVLDRATAAEAVGDARQVSGGRTNDLFEFLLSGPCVATTLADVGAVARTVTAEAGEGTVVADVPPNVDTRTVVDRFRDRHGDAELRARRDSEGQVPVRSNRGVSATLSERLTDRQLDALRTAFRCDYFEWPRGRTAEECAAVMGVSQPTFSQHLRAAQSKVFEAVFESVQADARED